tara:strand:+ start:298 stop:483 length:186 start_codon:yes stop_codon:yes gene_type:complete
MTREEKIQKIVELEFEELCMSSEVFDGWCKWVLLNGFTGLKDYTDVELDTKLKKLQESIDE